MVNNLNFNPNIITHRVNVFFPDVGSEISVHLHLGQILLTIVSDTDLVTREMT